MYILALNCGSSSLKYQVFDAKTKSAVVGGNVEKIGLPDSFVTQKYPDGTKQKKETAMKNHNEALNVVMFMLRDASIDMNEIKGVGHRVVLGGEKFKSSVEISDEFAKKILGEEKRITCRPADQIPNELDKFRSEINEYIEQDELVEATPHFIRMRKRILDATARKRAEIKLQGN